MDGDRDDEDFIPSPGLSELEIEVMLTSNLPSKENLKKESSRETKMWYTTKADVQYLNGVIGLDLAPATIKINKINAKLVLY